MPRNRRRSARALRIPDAADFDSVHCGDDRGDPLHENLALSGNIAAALAGRAAAGRNLGRAARGALGICATAYYWFSANQWSRQMVAGCRLEENAGENTGSGRGGAAME